MEIVIMVFTYAQNPNYWSLVLIDHMVCLELGIDLETLIMGPFDWDLVVELIAWFEVFD